MLTRRPSSVVTFTTVVAPAAYTFAPAWGTLYWRVSVAANSGWNAGQPSEFQVWNGEFRRS